MKIELFEPAMCCSSGVCGPAVDPKLVKLQETLRLIKERTLGLVEVERYNLSQNPDAFAQNAAVVAAMEQEGPQILPLTYIDGEQVAQSDYLSATEFEAALAARGVTVKLAGVDPHQRGCSGPSCSC